MPTSEWQGLLANGVGCSHSQQWLLFRLRAWGEA